jgi:signal transduction histidine kinase
MSTNIAASEAVDDNAALPPRTPVQNMMRHRGFFGRELNRLAARPLVLALCFLVLAVVNAASIFLVVASRSDSESVTHTLQVENSISDLLVLIQRAEGEQRGYRLTGRSGFLDAYRSTTDTIAPAIAALKGLTADNPVQQKAIAAFEAIVMQRIDGLNEGIRTRDAPADLLTGRGRVLMEDVRTAAGGMMAEEQRLLALRKRLAARTNIFLVGANLVGTALIMALAVFSVVAARGSARDSEKRAGELQAAVNELDAFCYSVSHDLRAPLRSIDGFSQILLAQHGQHLSEEAREFLQLVRDNTVQMGRLVDDLLTFARLGRRALSKQPVSAGKIVEQILQDQQQRAKGRAVDVSVGEMPQLWGDPALLRQVFVNLIDNAFKYTRMRAPAVIEIGASEIDGEQVCFVRDNGAGFDMRYADKLFGVFQRMHRAEEFEGTGVGLAIVQRIVQRHGGRVWAEAAPDRGATFYFTTGTRDHA